MEVVALVGAMAKLIGVGVAAWKAGGEDGWQPEEFEALKEALSTWAEFNETFGKETERTLVAQHCQLVTVAFGEAWRRHWHEDARLAPESLASSWRDLFRPRKVRERIRQVETALKAAKIELAFSGAALSSEIDRMDRIGANPLQSPWYGRLWEAFLAGSSPDSDMPLLLLEHGGESKRLFERQVASGFREGLVGERSRALREWLLGKQQDRPRAVRELLAARLLGFRTESIFPQTVTGLPHLSLERLYVEPWAKGADEAGPVVAALEAALSRPKTRIVLVLADFGRGKSLTARTLAYRLADRFLRDAETPSTELDYPIFVRCHESLNARSLDADTTVRRAQKRLADDFLTGADERDPAFELPADQPTVVLLDGLDEVQLREQEVIDLVASLSGRANGQRRFIVFSRPTAVPAKVLGLPEVQVLWLRDFDGAQVGRWLENWQALTPEPHPSPAELEKHALHELAQVPVLLFMIAQTWERVRSLTAIGRVDIYEQFLDLTIRSKLEYEQKHHPVVAEAAKRLRAELLAPGHLERGATLENAMLMLLGRVAWRAHCLEQASTAKPLTTHDLVQILRELKVGTAEVDAICRGVVLTFQTSLTDAAQELHFVHKSFREFLVARFWESRLQVLLELRSRQREPVEVELMEGRLLAEADQSLDFLIELCGRWPEARREKLVMWAEEAFNDERLSANTLAEDRRFALREAALAIGSALSAEGLQADTPHTLRSLLAVHWSTGRLRWIRAPRFRHSGAKLWDSNLIGADLSGADLSGAILSGAGLSGANLSEANLSEANLRGADLRGADLIEADLSGADLIGANLIGADLIGADLSGADLSGAILSGAILIDANLIGADLQGVDLTSANGDRTTILPDGIPRPPHWNR